MGDVIAIVRYSLLIALFAVPLFLGIQVFVHLEHLVSRAKQWPGLEELSRSQRKGFLRLVGGVLLLISAGLGVVVGMSLWG